MVNIGIDFGSTYTTVSVYRHETGMVEALTMSSSPYIPTTVALVGDRYEYGRAARSVTGKRGVRIFRGFKMLLAENNVQLLQSRGYTGEHTPARVAGRFLEYCLRQMLTVLHESSVDQLVVGVPEIWNQKLSTLDARTVLRDILQELDFVKKVQVVSEPAAATAFFAHNFKLSTGREYDGCILLIDYGGGTLDLTLTNVSTSSGAVEIKVLERSGAGENEDGMIGKAGIVYMESVMAEAIRQSGILGDKPLEFDGRFYKAVDSLEEELQYRTENIEAVFDECGTDISDELVLEDLEQEFTNIDYRGEYIPISYRLLVEVYDEIIRPVLEEKLALMTDYMDLHGIRYMDRDQEIFKIALVGGFGNYYLVRKQIEETFRFSTMDKRQEHIILNLSDREKSISLGAAMLSAGVVSIRNTAPLSIGLAARDVQGNSWVDYAITYKQDMEDDREYFPLDPTTEKPIRYLLTGGGVSRLVINRGTEPENARIMELKPQFAKLLSDIAQPMGTAALSFSMDGSGVLSMHIHDYPLDHPEPDISGRRIELAKCSELFITEEAGE